MHRKLLYIHNESYSLIYQNLRSGPGSSRHIISLSHHPPSLRSSPPATNQPLDTAESLQPTLEKRRKSIGQSLKMFYKLFVFMKSSSRKAYRRLSRL